MNTVVTNIRTAMKEQLIKAEWMDDETRAHALLKLSRMSQKIGYPDYISNETKILEGFSQVTIRVMCYCIS